MSYFEFTISEAKKHNMSYLHSHDFYEFYFQTMGTRRFFCSNKYYDLQNHVLIAIPPHTLHKFEGGPYKKIGLFFSADKLPADQLPLLTMLVEKKVIQFPENKAQQIYRTLKKIQQAYNSEQSNKKHLQVSLWFSYLMHQLYFAQTTELTAIRELPNTNYSSHDLSPTILKIMDYIQMRYNSNLSLEEICDQFHLSRSWLSQVFLEATGLTIFQYKNSLQLNRAKELLTRTSYSIEKIAKLVGYSSPNYFSKVFKKSTGNTPIEFRHAYQKQRS